jgi:hypothetical protein
MRGCHSIVMKFTVIQNNEKRKIREYENHALKDIIQKTNYTKIFRVPRMHTGCPDFQ